MSRSNLMDHLGSREVFNLFLRRIDIRDCKLISRVSSVLTTEADQEDFPTEDQARSCAQFICNEIKRIDELDTRGKMDLLEEANLILDKFLRPDLLVAQTWWVLKRYKVFRRMPVATQTRYMTELIAWRNIIGRHDGLYLAYFLPGILIFEHYPPDDQAPPSIDNNWFIWWFSLRKEGHPVVSCTRTQRAIDEDYFFLGGLRVRKPDDLQLFKSR